MSIFTGVIKEVEDIFNDLSDELKKAVNWGVTAAQSLKDFDDKNPEVADAITAFIPGTWDDTLKEEIRQYLPSILLELRLVQLTDKVQTVEELATEALALFNSLGFVGKSDVLHGLASMITQAASDGKITWGDSVMLVQYYYQHKLAA